MAVESMPSALPSASTPTSSAANLREMGMGSDAFLKLLVVQLQNQDPTSPQSNTEFIAQLAQFSSLEQLTSINQAVTAMANILGTAAPQAPVTADDRSASERKA
jgi:flagellar basal-body rod modification protein FlgD